MENKNDRGENMIALALKSDYLTSLYKQHISPQVSNVYLIEYSTYDKFGKPTYREYIRSIAVDFLHETKKELENNIETTTSFTSSNIKKITFPSICNILITFESGTNILIGANGNDDNTNSMSTLNMEDLDFVE